MFLWGRQGPWKEMPGLQAHWSQGGMGPLVVSSPGHWGFLSRHLGSAHSRCCSVPWLVQALTELSARAGGPEAHPGLHRAERRQLCGVFEAGPPGTTLGPLGEGRGPLQGHLAGSVWSLWAVLRGGAKGQNFYGESGTSERETLRIPDALVFTGDLCFLKQTWGSVE